MNSHLKDEQLVNYAYHTLTDTQRETMELHLAACRDCRARLSAQEALQRRIHYTVMDRRRGTAPSARMGFAAIAPKLKRSRRIAMFFTGSRQFLYGAATLAILVLLGVGLYVLVSNISQPAPAPQEAISQSTAAARPQSSEWLVLDKGNSGLPSRLLTPALAFDTPGNLWIGTRDGGLVKFDGTSWTVYNTDNSGLLDNQVVALADDGQGNMWIGTEGGLAKFDGENWTVYTTDNSELPYNAVHELAFDPQGTLWIGIGTFQGSGSGGLAKFNGESWTVYNTDNSDLPDNHIISLAFDAQGDLWIGTAGRGVAKFDGENWTVYDSVNSELPGDDVPSLAFDAPGNLWLGTNGGGLAKFDGENWTVHNKDNSGMPSNIVYDGLAIDGQGNKWIGTGGGLTKFDGENWTVYDPANSELPDNLMWSIAIDAHGNKWIGTQGKGLAVYREGGVILPEVGE